MKKTFNLSYTFTGGERHLQYTDINEFSRKLDECLEDPHVILYTIKIWTEEVEDGKV